MDTFEQSRNSWIKKDNRKHISERHKDMYEDILDDRRSSSDFRWATRTREDIPVYCFNKSRSSADIKKDVLKSKRVQYILEKLSQESGTSVAELTNQAAVILDEMAHNINMVSIRSFAFFLVKVFKQLFSHIYVNEDGVQQVRNQLKEYPVLLMPSHRSYIDFLLLSFIFFHYDLPLPAIAAAMDFMSMNFFGWLLRNSGAFYIQRSFGDNQLYWAVFTEYVQTQIANSDRPLEFFPEGTRSRTAKSLCPKYGLLSAVLEVYFKGKVSDIKIIPISISYSRILEEKLYAYELLGVPKPKESTYGLFKARGVLFEDYGNIHVHIGEAISVSSFSENVINREIHNLLPRYISSVSLGEQKLIMRLSYQILLCQQKYFVVSPWSMIAAVLMQNKEGISFKQLVKQVEWLKRQASNLGAYIDWPVEIHKELELELDFPTQKHSWIQNVSTLKARCCPATPANSPFWDHLWDRRDVCITHFMPGADDGWTDHHLISRLEIKIHCPPKQVLANTSCQRFNCAKLQNSQASQDFRESIERHLMVLPESTSIEDRWTSLCEAMTAAAKETIGFAWKKDQDWFHKNDETISRLIEAKLQMRLATAENKRKHQQASAECQQGIREAQNIWRQRKAEEMQNYAD
ncbi:dihydroxyacetone phosphate acyltransferase-like [Octopus vulgaris]|uniref:Dihydroxyacetone phosphate acyltransferase-like n=1 Tax=Octopus vulgaris TaxID=6645 RepID=A0AA36FAJ6_OCTVU|nr:dihydroxyacetone phosphate acyltransferase-like [Octopus vulgaris]